MQFQLKSYQAITQCTLFRQFSVLGCIGIQQPFPVTQPLCIPISGKPSTTTASDNWKNVDLSTTIVFGKRVSRWEDIPLYLHGAPTKCQTCTLMQAFPETVYSILNYAAG